MSKRIDEIVFTLYIDSKMSSSGVRETKINLFADGENRRNLHGNVNQLSVPAQSTNTHFLQLKTVHMPANSHGLK